LHEERVEQKVGHVFLLLHRDRLAIKVPIQVEAAVGPGGDSVVTVTLVETGACVSALSSS
ncbi:MAG: hypothetical protein OES69_17070, partial [Myxococcales bacterium]|nr:hypothetical protein [Myxococcales bacterium]